MGRASIDSQANEQIVRIEFCLSLVFTVFVSLLVLPRDDFLYSFLLLDYPPGAIAVVSCIESVLIYFVGQISRLDGPVCRPLVYASGGSSPSGLLNFVGSSETKIVSEGFEQRKLTARKSWFDQNDFGSAGVDSFRSKNSHITMTTS